MIYKTIDKFLESFIRREVPVDREKELFEDKIIEIVTYFKLLYINSGQGAFYNILSSYISDESGLFELLKKSYERQKTGKLIEEEGTNDIIIKSIFQNSFLKKFDKEAKKALPPIVAIFFSGFYEGSLEDNWLIKCRNSIVDVDVSEYHDIMKIAKEKNLEIVGLELIEDLIAIRERVYGDETEKLKSAYLLLAEGYGRHEKTKLELKNYEKVIAINEKMNTTNTEEMIQSCNRVGDIYQEEDSIVKCISFYEKALKAMVSLRGFKDLSVGRQNELIATTLLLHGDKLKACKALIMASGIYEINLGIDDPVTINLYNGITKLQIDLHDYKNAYKYFTKIFPHIISRYGEESEQVLTLKTNLAITCKNLNKFDEMDKLHNECLNVIMNYFDNEHETKGLIFITKAQHNEYLKDFNRALEYYEEALESYSNTLEENDDRLISVYGFIGSCYEKLEVYHEALKNYEKEYVLRKAETKDEDIKIINLKEKIGNISRLEGNYQNALSYLNEALNFKKEIYPDDHAEMLSLFINLGKLYSDTGNYVEGNNFLVKSLVIAESVLEPLDEVLIQINLDLAQLKGRSHETEEAFNYYNEAINKLTDLGRNLEVAKVYKDLTKTFLETGQFNDAIDYAIKAKVTTELAVGEDDILNLDCSNLLAHVYNESGNCEKAIFEYQNVCKILIDKFGKKNHNLAIAYENMSGVFVTLERLTDALEFLNLALKINMGIFGENSKEVSNNYSNIAFIQYLQKNHNEALMHYEKVLQINEVRNEMDFSVTSEIFYALGRLYFSLEDYEKALKYFKRSMTLMENVVNDLEVVIEENYLIEQCYKFEEEKKYTECINIFEQYLLERVKKQGVSTIGKGAIYQRIAECYKNLPEYDFMLQVIYLNKSLLVKIKIYGENNPAMANDFVTFATVNKDKGDKQLALQYFQKALNIFEIMENENHFLVAEVKLNIGILLRENGKFGEAIGKISDALKYFESIGADSRLIWKALTELGNTYLEADETEAALEYFIKSEKICSEEDYAFKGCAAISFYNLGDAYRILNHKREAVVNYEKALALEKEINGSDTFITGALETNIGLIYKSAGQLHRALEYFERAKIAYGKSVGTEDNNYKYINILLEEAKLKIMYEEDKKASGVKRILKVVKGY